MQKQGAASPVDDCERSAEKLDGAERTVFADVKWRRRDGRHGFCVKHTLSQIPSHEHLGGTERIYSLKFFWIFFRFCCIVYGDNGQAKLLVRK